MITQNKMNEYYDKFLLSDCISTMQNIIATQNKCVVDLTFTSPPYFNAKSYSQYDCYGTYLSEMENVFKLVFSITKPGRFCVINSSPVIVPRKSRNKSSTRIHIPFDIHQFMLKIGWNFVDDIIWLKPDGAALNRNGGFFNHLKPLLYKPNIVTEYIMVYRKGDNIDTEKSVKRDYTIDSMVNKNYEKTNVWRISPSRSAIHPATFPQELANRVISYYSMQGDLVFDPFAGIGTTALCAQKLNRHFLSTEINKDYFEHALKVLRINHHG